MRYLDNLTVMPGLVPGIHVLFIGLALS